MTSEQPVTRYVEPGGMAIEETGIGERVILVHGGGASGINAWKPQLALADSYKLVIVSRLGYPGSRPTEREDFDVDARLLEGLLEDGAHLVGHSYGAIGAALAAVRRPAAVRSLTMIDAPCSSAARGNPVVDAYESEMQRLVASPPADPSEFVRGVFAILDSKMKLPDPLPPPLIAFGGRLPKLRWPWEADVPFEELCSRAFPKLVISGGRNPLYEVIADAIAPRLGAERYVLTDAGHDFADAGEALTARIRAFLD